MLCCFPFSHISEELIGLLTRSLGPLALYQGLNRPVADPMRAWVERSQLDVRRPSGVDQARLQQVLKQFKTWADLHQGGLADLAAYLRSGTKGAPLVDETSPTQISTQVRSHGREPAGVDPLFHACLFLALAQDYDVHQEALARDMGAVEGMERQMLAHLDGASPGPGPLLAPSGPDPGLYMTDARIQAWALLAACDDTPAWAFITPSRAVLEAVLDRLPQARPVLHWDLGGGDLGEVDGAAIAERREHLKELAFSRAPWTAPLQPTPPAGGADGQRIAFYGVPGSTPRKTLALLHGQKECDPSCTPESPEPQNTLIGIMERLPRH